MFGPGQHLAERQHLDELLARQPALALDQLALRDREHAAEALQREAVEGEEEVGVRGRPRAHAVVGGVLPPAARDRPVIAARAAAPAGPQAERDRGGIQARPTQLSERVAVRARSASRRSTAPTAWPR